MPELDAAPLAPSDQAPSGEPFEHVFLGSFLGEEDHRPVIQIDTEPNAALRVNLNDAVLFDGKPESTHFMPTLSSEQVERIARTHYEVEFPLGLSWSELDEDQRTRRIQHMTDALRAGHIEQ